MAKTEMSNKRFLKDFKSCSDLGINIIVIPLVDGGSIEKTDQSKSLRIFLKKKICLWKWA